MKHYLTLTVFFLSLFLFSCTDPCQDVSCGANGVCEDGTCLCDDGYEGTNCEIEARTQYLGTYEGTLTCPDQDPQAARYTFEAGTEIDEMIFFNPDDANMNSTKVTLVGNVATSPEIIEVIFGIETTLVTEFTFTDENNITVEVTTSAFGMNIVCTGEGMRE